MWQGGKYDISLKHTRTVFKISVSLLNYVILDCLKHFFSFIGDMAAAHSFLFSLVHLLFKYKEFVMNLVNLKIN